MNAPKFGSSRWDRTTDILVNSQMQLPLCYWGIKICHYSIVPSEGMYECSSVVSILKHTVITTMLLRFTADMSVLCVLECRVLLHDMIGLIPYPVVLLMCYRHTFMYTVRPFKDYYSVLSGPRYLGITALIQHCSINRQSRIVDPLCVDRL